MWVQAARLHHVRQAGRLSPHRGRLAPCASSILAGSLRSRQQATAWHLQERRRGGGGRRARSGATSMLSCPFSCDLQAISPENTCPAVLPTTAERHGWLAKCHGWLAQPWPRLASQPWHSRASHSKRENDTRSRLPERPCGCFAQTTPGVLFPLLRCKPYAGNGMRGLQCAGSLQGASRQPVTARAGLRLERPGIGGLWRPRYGVPARLPERAPARRKPSGRRSYLPAGHLGRAPPPRGRAEGAGAVFARPSG
jgi:hypothetical protein